MLARPGLSYSLKHEIVKVFVEPLWAAVHVIYDHPNNLVFVYALRFARDRVVDLTANYYNTWLYN